MNDNRQLIYNPCMPFRPALTSAALKKAKSPPPDTTNQEAEYLKSLGEKQKPVSIKLVDGEVVRGWIEYYDQKMVRLTREGAPNLFIFKHDIVYIAEDTGRRPVSGGEARRSPSFNSDGPRAARAPARPRASQSSPAEGVQPEAAPESAAPAKPETPRNGE